MLQKRFLAKRQVPSAIAVQNSVKPIIVDLLRWRVFQTKSEIAKGEALNSVWRAIVDALNDPNNTQLTPQSSVEDILNYQVPIRTTLYSKDCKVAQDKTVSIMDVVCHSRDTDQHGNTKAFKDLKSGLKWGSNVYISLDENKNNTQKSTTFRAKPQVPSAIAVQNSVKPIIVDLLKWRVFQTKSEIAKGEALNSVWQAIVDALNDPNNTQLTPQSSVEDILNYQVPIRTTLYSKDCKVAQDKTVSIMDVVCHSRNTDQHGNTKAFKDLKSGLKWNGVYIKLETGKTSSQVEMRKIENKAFSKVDKQIMRENAVQNAKKFVNENDCKSGHDLYARFFKNNSEINWSDKNQQEKADHNLSQLLNGDEDNISNHFNP